MNKKNKNSNVSKNDIFDVAQWLNTSVENVKVNIVKEPIEKFKKQILEMYQTFDEFPEDAKRINKILKLLKKGEQPLPIYVTENDENKFVMEGRHRMVAFWLLDMTDIPVAYVSPKKNLNSIKMN